MPIRSIVVACAAGAALALLLALLTPGSPLRELTRAAQAATVTVDGGNNWFCDNSYQGGVCETTVVAGDTVTWQIVQGTHTVTECDATFANCPPTGGGFDSGIIGSGTTFSHTFTQPGTVAYLCTLHDAQMRGRIIVQAPTPTPTPGPATPTSTPAPPTPSPTPSPSPTPTPSPSPAPTPYYTFSQVANTGNPKTDGLAVIPGTAGEAVAITQDGDLWKLDLGSPSATPAPFGSVRDRMTRQGDEGLLGIAFRPGEADRVYINYTTGTEYYRPFSADPNFPTSTTVPPDPKRNVISRFSVVNGMMDPDSEEKIFESLRPGDWHTLNQMAFGPDGYLYAGSGDGGWIEAIFDSDRGQGTGNDLATIIRIAPNEDGPGYTVPPDNPFADGSGPNADEVWAYGTRNPWRISFDRQTGQLWAADVGQWLYEEIDIIEPGGNFGWYIMEGDVCHVSGCTPPADHVPPFTAYCNRYNYGCGETDDCAVIGGYVYRGTELPELDGWYIYGDFCSGRIRAVDSADSSSAFVLLDTALNPVSFAETPGGELLLVDYSGAIYQLTFDSDADGVGDVTDNCPAWPNPLQNLPPWLVPPGDGDCDGFTTASEEYAGTLPLVHCAATPAANDEPSPDAWPADLNDDQRAGLPDVLAFIPVFGAQSPDPPYNARFDFNGDGRIGLTDVLGFIPVMNQSCAS